MNIITFIVNVFMHLVFRYCTLIVYYYSTIMFDRCYCREWRYCNFSLWECRTFISHTAFQQAHCAFVMGKALKSITSPCMELATVVVMADRVESLRSNTWASGGMEWPEQPDPSGQASKQADLDVPSASHILSWFWLGKIVGWLHEFRRMLDLAQNGRLLISPGHHG